ncbi:MAG: hypothetical protein ACPHV3_03775, partial [Vibrio sp.]
MTFSIRLFLTGLLIAVISGCSSSYYPSAYAGSSTVFFGQTWYDDYWDYWMYEDGHCCHDPDDFEDSVQDWWDTLDQDERDDVRDDLNAWLDGGDPDYDAVQDALKRQWDSLPSDKQNQIIEQGQKLKGTTGIMPVSGAVSTQSVKNTIDNASPEAKQAAQEK